MNYSGYNNTKNGMMYFWCSGEGVPQPRIVWLHNGLWIPVNSSPRHEVMIVDNITSSEPLLEAVESTLIVSALRLRDAGTYLCRVDPGYSSSNIENPLILESPFEVAVYQGNSN